MRRSILIARERGDTSRGEKVGVEDVNGAAGEYDSSKREELGRDTLDERQRLEDEFAEIGKFVNFDSKANVFLIDKNLPDAEIDPIKELVDLRLVHRVRNSVTVADRPGKTFEAYMLDVSQYTVARKRRDVEIIEFWRDNATDSIRRTGLIYKELNGTTVIAKRTPQQRQREVTDSAAQRNTAATKVSHAVEFNPNELSVLRALANAGEALDLATLALRAFPKIDPVRGNSWVRNSLRRLLAARCVTKVAQGTYKIAAAGRSALPRDEA
jgi:hypothetical protein